MSSLPGYDAWRTGGDYSKQLLVVLCPECDEWTPVKAETEYGSTYWTPEECKHCDHSFTGDETWESDEGPDPYDRYEEED